MNEKVKQHLIQYNRKNDWPLTEEDLIETLEECGKEVSLKLLCRNRWWESVFIIKEIDGMLIGFESATTTGDENAKEKGWEFDPETICEMEAEEKVITTTVYKIKE